MWCFCTARLVLGRLACAKPLHTSLPSALMTGTNTLAAVVAAGCSRVYMGRYSTAALLEINAHSLFSKWFSESGKLVMKLFAHIQELVDDSDALVCVLIGEHPAKRRSPLPAVTHVHARR